MHPKRLKVYSTPELKFTQKHVIGREKNSIMFREMEKCRKEENIMHVHALILGSKNTAQNGKFT